MSMTQFKKEVTKAIEKEINVLEGHTKVNDVTDLINHVIYTTRSFAIADKIKKVLENQTNTFAKSNQFNQEEVNVLKRFLNILDAIQEPQAIYQVWNEYRREQFPFLSEHLDRMIKGYGIQQEYQKNKEGHQR